MAKLIDVAAYYRMSDDKQENSIERQRSQVEPYAARSGYRIVAEYIDEGIPGDEVDRREDFKRLLADAQCKRFSVILCDDKDRFGRFDSIDYGYYVKPLRDAKVRLETVAQGRIDWNSFAGRITDAVTQEAKKQEVQALSRRVLTEMLRLAKGGGYLGGPVPYGLAVQYRQETREGKVISLAEKYILGDPAEVRVVKLIFRLYGEEGYSLRAVSRELKEQRVKDPSGKPVWNITTLRKVLKNRKYIGDRPWNQRHVGKYSEYKDGRVNNGDTKGDRQNPREDWVVAEGCHEAIVGRDLFEKVQLRLAENRKRTTPLAGGGDFLLTGIVLCGHCGHRLIGRTFAGKRYYQCGHYGHVGRHGCLGYTIAEEKLATAILAKLRRVMKDNKKVLREEIARKAQTDAETAPARMADLEKKIAALSKKLDAGMERMALMPPELLAEFAAKVREWKEERDRLAKELAEVQNPPQRADLEEVLKIAEKFMDRLDLAAAQSEPALFRSALRDLVEKVEVTFDEVKREGKKYTKYVFREGAICPWFPEKPAKRRKRFCTGSKTFC
jgi:DNA invertase Pin-like site-specific DNA recombinase